MKVILTPWLCVFELTHIRCCSILVGHISEVWRPNTKIFWNYVEHFYVNAIRVVYAYYCRKLTELPVFSANRLIIFSHTHLVNMLPCS